MRQAPTDAVEEGSGQSGDSGKAAVLRTEEEGEAWFL